MGILNRRRRKNGAGLRGESGSMKAPKEMEVRGLGKCGRGQKK